MKVPTILLWCAMTGLGLVPTSSSFVMLHPTRNSIRELGVNRRYVAFRHPRSISRRSTLSMHMMGHSHSHHHHHDHSDTNNKSASSTTQPLKRRRLVAMVLFCAIAILGPPSLIQKRALQQRDFAAFTLTSTALLALEPIRREILQVFRRIRSLTHGITKHSTPISANYFFRNKSAADRITLLGGVINLFLSAGKFFVGLACNSSALIADAGHSLSDLFSDFVTLWAVQVGRLPPDEDHPYGHGKFEAIGSLFLSLTLLGTGIGVGAASNKKLLEILALQKSAEAVVAVPGVWALFMAGLSIVSKEWLFRVTRAVGERLNSQVVIANAWHHRSDAYSSVLALGSIALAIFVPGFVAADAVAGLFVAGMICMTGAEILGESIAQLTDTASSNKLVERVTAIALQQGDDVSSVVRVRARQVGSKSIVDMSVTMPDDRTASAARAVEERLKQQILREEDDHVLDVEVKATSPEGVVCPLLVHQQTQQEDANGASSSTMLSATEAESCVRDEILKRHPEVKSVEGVTVHYQDTVLVNVDVDIRLDSALSVAAAGSVANNLRDTLEASNQIHKANIFLDLNIEAKDRVA